MLLLLRPLLSLYLTCALLLHVETVESEQYIPSTSISVEQCLNSSVADGFYLISSTRPLGQITMGDQLLFLMARMVEHKKSLCENVEARSRGDSILQSFVSTGKKFVVASDAAVVQSIYSRVMVVGRQYGTDQNDGDPMYAFYHVFKASDYRVEQLTDVSIGIDVELFWFSWSPPRAAHYELSVRVDIDNCTGALLHLESNRCQPAAYTAVKVSFRAQYADKITPIYARTDISTCDLSDMTNAHWFYSPKGPRPNSLRDVWTTPPNPRWFPDNCPSFNSRLAESKLSKHLRSTICVISSPHTRRLCHRMDTEWFGSSICREGARHEKASELVAEAEHCPRNSSMVVLSLMHHHPDYAQQQQSLPSTELPKVNATLFTAVLATLSADPMKIPSDSSISVKSKLAISPYLQRLYSESWKEAIDRSYGSIKKWSSGGFVFLDAFTPSFMIDDIAHSDADNDPWHYDGDAKWFYDFVLDITLVSLHCFINQNC